MIGSGIFIVPADIARQVGSAGWLLMVWVVTGLLTIAAALSYGELAAMMPKAGGQYVYLREAYSPLWGFLYGWTLFLVIQTGTIAAVAVGFARFLGVLFPAISPTAWIIPPIDLSDSYALSLSMQQLVGDPADRLPDLAEHPRHPARQADPEHLHLGQDPVADRPDPAGHPGGAQRRGDRGQLRRLLDAARRRSRSGPDSPSRRPVGGHGRGLRPVRRLLRRPGGLAVLVRRLEQHHLHRRRGEEPAAQHPALARRRHHAW